MQYDVLIVGAGPTGLVLALWLTKLGREGSHRRQDGGPARRRAPWPCRRARSNCTGSSISRTRWSRAATGSRRSTLGQGERKRAHCRSRQSASGVTPYPVSANLPARSARAAADRAAARLGVVVERRTELARYGDGDGVARSFAARTAAGDVRGGLYRRLRRRALDGAGDDRRRLSRWDLPAAVLRRRRRGAARRSMANCMSISTRPTSWRFSPRRAGRARLVGSVRDEARRAPRDPEVRGRERPRDQRSQARDCRR